MPDDARRAAVINAIAAVQRGEVIAIPTDTVYGLGCDPGNAAAVERIYAIKRRPDTLELTLLAADARDVAEMVVMSPLAEALGERFWPGALSIVLPVGKHRLVIPRSGTTLSVRVPAHPMLRDILAVTGPLATTSANRHGEPAVSTAAEVAAALGGDVAVVVDGGRGAGMASTIIDCSNDPPRILREGPISAAELRPLLEAAY